MSEHDVTQAGDAVETHYSGRGKPAASHPCDTCGRPAMNFARDVIRITEPVDICERYELGRPKAGCSDHPVKSFTIEKGG